MRGIAEKRPAVVVPIWVKSYLQHTLSWPPLPITLLPMDSKAYSSDVDYDSQRPPKRARYTPPAEANGHSHRTDPPPLSLSILGVEPLDEFIREVADFVHHMIMTRPNQEGAVEVEAKVGVLREKGSGQRLSFPVLVETSTYTLYLQNRTVLHPISSSCSRRYGHPL